MKIRFRESIASARWSYQEGQVVEIVGPVPPHLRPLLRARNGGRPAVAEVVREDASETAVAPEDGERPTQRHGRGGSRRRSTQASGGHELPH
jgi:hypothetical protein